jgi:riboflavin synthase
VFSGITQGTFLVTRVERAPDLLRYEVDLGRELSHGLRIGASVSIDGVCQTVTPIEEGRASFDAIRETLDRTTLGALAVGTRVAVERSLRAGDEIGGHEVSGHVTGTGVIESARHAGDVHELRIQVPAGWMRYILARGFIAVEGSSLTVGDTDPKGLFALHLIPETLRLTNLGKKQPGDRVNIELCARTVAVVNTIERVLAERGLS